MQPTWAVQKSVQQSSDQSTNYECFAGNDRANGVESFGERIADH